MTRQLFSGVDGLVAAKRIDARIDRLPGLAGLGLLQRETSRVDRTLSTRTISTAHVPTTDDVRINVNGTVDVDRVAEAA